jgi:hypothetical protein
MYEVLVTFYLRPQVKSTGAHLSRSKDAELPCEKFRLTVKYVFFIMALA